LTVPELNSHQVFGCYMRGLHVLRQSALQLTSRLPGTNPVNLPRTSLSETGTNQTVFKPGLRS
jgi:hypothetical protein